MVARTLEVWFGNQVVACWCEQGKPIKERLNRSKHTFIVDFGKIRQIASAKKFMIDVGALQDAWKSWEDDRIL